MALTNFKATIWSDAVQASLDASLVAGALVNTSFQGELGRGKTVRVNKLAALSVEDYDGTTPIAAETLSSTYVDLNVDQAKYAAFKLDDVDAAQAAPALMAEATREAGRRIALEIDKYVIETMYAGRAGANSLGNIELSSTVLAWDVLSQLAVALDNQNVPATDRFVIVSPAFAAKLAADTRLNRATVAGDMVAMSHYVGEAAGFAVYKSTQIDSEKIVAGHTIGCAFAQQISQTEAVRSNDFFADVVRTLAVYGAAVIRPETIATATWSV